MTKSFISTPSKPLATALLLAAGRGERMRPLTDLTPKPLLSVRGQRLIQWAMQGLQRGGVKNLVINTAWLGEQIPQHFGGVLVTAGQGPMHLHYSQEGVDFGAALETAGGIVRALPLLADVFWVAAGDVFVPDFVFAPEAYARFESSPQLAHIWLVPNPAHNLDGDFGLSADGLAPNLPKLESTTAHGGALSNTLTTGPTSQLPRYTFSTIALYKRAFFEATWCNIPAGNPAGVKAPLAAMLRAAMDNDAVSASLYTGAWTDVGTPERLAALNAIPAP
ncbi:sugar phosphate nucleotidyltransferase [Limnohabitans sp.]|uniref:sugar phosphate nucleotidyltransferase n=1 Tax=Limnohabitans sp. TaxID=1907725 RepID=UPI00286EC891|nr:sugar phosphate nucleotidyltransferase [Limnohabitans sp.]